MIKNIFVALIFVSVALTGCGKSSSRIDDARAYLNEMTAVQNEYANALEKAKDSKEVVAAINAFGDKMTGLAARGKELEKKHGEMNDADKNPELKAEFEKFKSAAERASLVSMGVIKKYMKDQDVTKAMMEMRKKMQGAM